VCLCLPHVSDTRLSAEPLNCEERLAADPVGLAQRMADLLDLDGDRVRLRLFARCVIEGVDDPLLQTVADALTPPDSAATPGHSAGPAVRAGLRGDGWFARLSRLCGLIEAVNCPPDDRRADEARK
jgi:hypothetical protein